MKMAMAIALPSYSPLVPDELIVEILSWLPVKALMRLRCVCNAWNTLIFDPAFVKLHLQRSSKNNHILLTAKRYSNGLHDFCVAPCSIGPLLENPSSTIDDCVIGFEMNNVTLAVCNGLVCLGDYVHGDGVIEYWRVRVWNPATRIMSQDSPLLCIPSSNYEYDSYSVRCGFGFDDLCETYKVVAILFDSKSQEFEVKVHCLGDTCWRKILSCCAIPVRSQFGGQFVSGTVNWLVLPGLGFHYNWKTVTIDQLVIFSYDLKNETYKYLSLPDGLSEVPPAEPYLWVLKGCLCLLHNNGRTHYVVWLVREFGIEKSWTQLLNVNLEILGHDRLVTSCILMMPLCLSEDEDVLLLADHGRRKFVIFNWRASRIYRTECFNKNTFCFFSYDYVQSLVLPY